MEVEKNVSKSLTNNSYYNFLNLYLYIFLCYCPAFSNFLFLLLPFLLKLFFPFSLGAVYSIPIPLLVFLDIITCVHHLP